MAAAHATQTDGYMSMNVTFFGAWMQSLQFAGGNLISGTASTKIVDIASIIETVLNPFLTLPDTLFARNETCSAHFS
jgi:hypothetical protein